MPELGRSLIVLGALIALVGVILLLAGKVPWVGRLPGDIRWEGKNVSFYFPLATSVLLSVGLTLLFWLLSFLRRER